MNDALGVRGIEGIGHFGSECEQEIGFEGPSVDALLQRHAIEMFHGNERLAILFADVVDGANVRVIQGRGGLRFALETGQGLGIAGNVLRQKLERDEAMKASVLSLVDDTHATAAEFFENAVVGECLADARVAAWHVWLILGLGCEASQREGWPVWRPTNGNKNTD